MRRNGEPGSAGSVFYKVRRKSTGLFFKPEYRDPKWEQNGRAYPTLNGAKTAARNAREKGDQLIDPYDLEIVEFEAVERQCHPVN
jgi:hypothetical protein